MINSWLAHVGTVGTCVGTCRWHLPLAPAVGAVGTSKVHALHWRLPRAARADANLGAQEPSSRDHHGRGHCHAAATMVPVVQPANTLKRIYNIYTTYIPETIRNLFSCLSIFSPVFGEGSGVDQVNWIQVAQESLVVGWVQT